MGNPFLPDGNTLYQDLVTRLVPIIYQRACGEEWQTEDAYGEHWMVAVGAEAHRVAREAVTGINAAAREDLGGAP